MSGVGYPPQGNIGSVVGADFIVDSDFNVISATGSKTKFATASLALQYTINNGNNIRIKNGTYPNVNITINKNNVILRGNGRDYNNAGTGTLLQLAANGGIDCSNAAGQRWNILIGDLTIDGGNASGNGIHTDNQGDNLKAAFFILENLEMKNFKRAGAYFPISIKNFESFTLRNSYIHGAGTTGACLKLYAAGAVGYYAGNALIMRNMFDAETNSLPSILIDTTGNNNKEIDEVTIGPDNHFYGTGHTQQVGIKLDSTDAPMKQIKIAHNRCEHTALLTTTGAGHIRYGCFVHDNWIESNVIPGISLNANCDRWLIHDNYLDVNAGEVGIQDDSTETIGINVFHHNYFSGSGTHIATTNGLDLDSMLGLDARYMTADYGVAWAGWPPAGLIPHNGKHYLVYNTNGAGSYRVYYYMNGVWKYTTPT